MRLWFLNVHGEGREEDEKEGEERGVQGGNLQKKVQEASVPREYFTKQARCSCTMRCQACSIIEEGKKTSVSRIEKCDCDWRSLCCVPCQMISSVKLDTHCFFLFLVWICSCSYNQTQNPTVGKVPSLAPLCSHNKREKKT